MKQTKHFKRTAFNLSAKSMVSTLLLLIAMLMPQAAWATNFISEVKISASQTKSTASDRLTNDHYTIVKGTDGNNADLNGGVGSSSDYIYIGYKTSTDASKAITGLLIVESNYDINPEFNCHKTAHTTTPISYQGKNWYRCTNYGDELDSDINRHNSKGKDITLFYTTDGNTDDGGTPLLTITLVGNTTTTGVTYARHWKYDTAQNGTDNVDMYGNTNQGNGTAHYITYTTHTHAYTATFDWHFGQGTSVTDITKCTATTKCAGCGDTHSNLDCSLAFYSIGKAPTCTEYGWNGYQATVTANGKDFSDNQEAQNAQPYGHGNLGKGYTPTYTWGGTYDNPTCSLTLKCNICGENAAENISLPVEVLKDLYKAPTCTEDGYQGVRVYNVYFPTNSKDNTFSYLSQYTFYIDKLGHHFIHEASDDLIAVNPTCNSNAHYFEKCENCGDKNSITWEAANSMFNHNMNMHAAEEPTCTTDGNKLYYTCSRSCCKDKYYVENKAHATAVDYSAIYMPGGHIYTDHLCNRCHNANPSDVREWGFAGECKWYLYNNGDMIVFPTNGVSGKLAWTSNPLWFAYNTYIYSLKFIGNISVSSLENAFANSHIRTVDLGNLNTSQVTNMAYMFSHCESLRSVDFSSLDMSNVTNMDHMFAECSRLESLDLTVFNTEKVTNMSNMFYGCYNLTTFDFSSFNTANVTNMSGMFRRCNNELTTLDLSSFDTRNVTDMSNMFQDCSSLKNLIIGNFDMQKVRNTTDMFASCAITNLELHSVPYLANNTFNTHFSGDGKTVNYVLDDNSVIYARANNLPAATSAPTYTRAISASSDWGTLVLPFEAKSDANVQLYTLTAASGENLTFTPAETVAANTPCVFKKKVADATSVVFTANTVAAPAAAAITATAAVDGLSMNGTYTALNDQTGIYFIAQNKFWKADDPITIAPFRAWFEGNLGAGASVKALNILVEEADGIANISNANGMLNGKYMENGRVVIVKNGKKFNLNGQKIK